MDVTGQVALVTGAGRRVGAAIAIGLARAGATVAVHYNASADGANDTVREIERHGGAAVSIQADLTRGDAPARLVDDVIARLGTLDVLVNSAAVMMRTPVGEVTAAEFDDMMALNARAPFLCAQAAARVMRGRGGVIINIADLAGLEAWKGYVPHGMTKAAVISMTSGLAKVLAPDIRVNAIAPGAVLLPDEWGEEEAERLARTTPLGRIGSPEDVVAAVLYLVRAEFVTGETLIVDGGRHVR